MGSRCRMSHTESVTGLLLARARRSEQYPLNHASSIDRPARLREITNLPLPMRMAANLALPASIARRKHAEGGPLDDRVRATIR
jgi:hypothetical protein